MSEGSRLFVPYRALGFVSMPIPFAIQQRGGESFITTSVGKSWHTYNCARLNLLFVGQRQNKKIRALAVKDDFVFSSCGSEIIVSRRGREVSVLREHSLHSNVVHLLVFGDCLLSYGEDQKLVVWEIGTWKKVRAIALPSEFRVTAMIHPPTYLNKILLGGEDGTMQLWNIKTGSLIYEFGGWTSGISCLATSPALDVVGIGLIDGRIIVHNLKYDETVVDFAQKDGTVTALHFRTDGPPMVASGTMAGHITLWDLSKRSLAGTMLNAHAGSISQMVFLPQEPVLVSAGSDNTVKMWLFDSADPTSARLLRQRSGHTAPPTHVRFYGDKNMLISAGRDRSLRLFSTIQDSQNREMSQGSGLAKKSARNKMNVEEMKLPMITGFASCPLREKDWDNVVTCHDQSGVGYTWSVDRGVIGKHKLKLKTKSIITAVTLTSCGNYAILGTEDGRIEVFNMQSGRQRITFDDPYSGGKGKGKGKAEVEHYERSIQSVACDAVNNEVISAALDGVLRFWCFQTGKLNDCVEVGSPISLLKLHRDNGLIAVVSDDLILRVYDLKSRQLVRTFSGHSNRITDLEYSPDGRWLCSASLDGTVRICDIPSSHCVDWFRVDRPCTSIAFSPRGDMIATTHSDSLGIFLWINRAQYERVELNPVLSPPSIDHYVHRPHAGESEHGQYKKKSQSESDGAGLGKGKAVGVGVTPLEPNLATLSGVTDGRWTTVNLMDEIRERNKPKEAPQVPERAPFFLPSIEKGGMNKRSREDMEGKGKGEGGDIGVSVGGSRILDFGSLSHITQSPFSMLIARCEAEDDYSDLLKHMREVVPAAADLEYATLDNRDESMDLRRLLKFFETTLRDPSEFELKNAHLHLFIKHHGMSLAQHKDIEVRKALQRIGEEQRVVWKRVEGLLQNTLCLTSYLSDQQ